jgi:hypothetical protein
MTALGRRGFHEAGRHAGDPAFEWVKLGREAVVVEERGMAGLEAADRGVEEATDGLVHRGAEVKSTPSST